MHYPSIRNSNYFYEYSPPNSRDSYVPSRQYSSYPHSSFYRSKGSVASQFQKSFPMRESTLSCDSPCLRDRKVFQQFYKTDIQTMDKNCYYRIYKGELYFKPRRVDRGFVSNHWEKLHFNGIATRVSADNEHLVVIDENQRVHIAKTNTLRFAIKNEDWKPISKELEWKENWFNLKGFTWAVNMFKPQGLYTMEQARKIALSHRNGESYYLNEEKPVYGESTTLYMLNPAGNRLFYADPRLHTHFDNELTMPEDGEFIAENMDASGSTVFLIQRARDENGNEIHQMYTRYADMDSTGGMGQTKRDVLRSKDWDAQPSIPLWGYAKLTKSISIQQTGSHSRQRMLYVEGMDADGYTGYYYKTIRAKTWQFMRTDHFIPEEAFLPEYCGNGIELGPQVSYDYRGKIQLQKGKCKATLKGFCENRAYEKGLNTTLEIRFPNGKRLSCSLYAKRDNTLPLGLGKMLTSWTLDIPPNTSLPKGMQEVHLIEHSDHIYIEGKGFSARFEKSGNPTPPLKLLHPFIRIILWATFLVLQVIKFNCRVFERIVNKIQNNPEVFQAKERLHQAIQLHEPENLKRVMYKLVKEDPTLANIEIVNLLCSKEILPHIKEVLSGANVVVENSDEDWYRILSSITKKHKNLKKPKERISSHEYLPGTKMYGLQTALFGELLFYVDPDGNFRFQFESHSLRNLFQAFYHGVDYIKYRIEGEQQGPHGVSRHTDSNPIRID